MAGAGGRGDDAFHDGGGGDDDNTRSNWVDIDDDDYAVIEEENDILYEVPSSTLSCSDSGEFVDDINSSSVMSGSLVRYDADNDAPDWQDDDDDDEWGGGGYDAQNAEPNTAVKTTSKQSSLSLPLPALTPDATTARDAFEMLEESEEEENNDGAVDAQRIRVVVRVRPALDAGGASSQKEKDAGNVVVPPGSNRVMLRSDTTTKTAKWMMSSATTKEMPFDRVFDERHRQHDDDDEEEDDGLEFYEGSGCKAIVRAFARGFNGTIFAYGQTGSGKTYTMSQVVENAASHIFSIINGSQESTTRRRREYLVRCGVMEIYNDKVIDLLNISSGNNNNNNNNIESTGAADDIAFLKLRDDGSGGTNPLGGVHIEGLQEHHVSTADELLDVIEAAARRRKVACTRLNSTSSRSHMVIRLILESQPADFDDKDSGGAGKSKYDAAAGESNHPDILVSCLNLVDLAGSERVKESSAEGEQLREACHINRSLLTLGTCIYQLAAFTAKRTSADNNGSGKQLSPRSAREAALAVSGSTYIPYRSSALTRILQPSLGGNAYTCIVACINPLGGWFLEQTRSTLQFASRAMQVMNKPKRNSVEPWSAEVSVLKYRAQIVELQRQLRQRDLEMMKGGGGKAGAAAVKQLQSMHDVLGACKDKLDQKRMQVSNLEHLIVSYKDACATAAEKEELARAEAARERDAAEELARAAKEAQRKEMFEVSLRDREIEQQRARVSQLESMHQDALRAQREELEEAHRFAMKEQHAKLRTEFESQRLQLAEQLQSMHDLLKSCKEKLDMKRLQNAELERSILEYKDAIAVAQEKEQEARERLARERAAADEFAANAAEEQAKLCTEIQMLELSVDSEIQIQHALERRLRDEMERERANWNDAHDNELRTVEQRARAELQRERETKAEQLVRADDVHRAKCEKMEVAHLAAMESYRRELEEMHHNLREQMLAAQLEGAQAAHKDALIKQRDDVRAAAEAAYDTKLRAAEEKHMQALGRLREELEKSHSASLDVQEQLATERVAEVEAAHEEELEDVVRMYEGEAAWRDLAIESLGVVVQVAHSRLEKAEGAAATATAAAAARRSASASTTPRKGNFRRNLENLLTSPNRRAKRESMTAIARAELAAHAAHHVPKNSPNKVGGDDDSPPMAPPITSLCGLRKLQWG